jgi:hypothetical protein
VENVGIDGPGAEPAALGFRANQVVPAIAANISSELEILAVIDPLLFLQLHLSVFLGSLGPDQLSRKGSAPRECPILYPQSHSFLHLLSLAQATRLEDGRRLRHPASLVHPELENDTTGSCLFPSMICR